MIKEEGGGDAKKEKILSISSTNEQEKEEKRKESASLVSVDFERPQPEVTAKLSDKEFMESVMSKRRLALRRKSSKEMESKASDVPPGKARSRPVTASQVIRVVSTEDQNERPASRISLVNADGRPKSRMDSVHELVETKKVKKSESKENCQTEIKVDLTKVDSTDKEAPEGNSDITFEDIEDYGEIGVEVNGTGENTDTKTDFGEKPNLSESKAMEKLIDSTVGKTVDSVKPKKAHESSLGSHSKTSEFGDKDKDKVKLASFPLSSTSGGQSFILTPNDVVSPSTELESIHSGQKVKGRFERHLPPLSVPKRRLPSMGRKPGRLPAMDQKPGRLPAMSLKPRTGPENDPTPLKGTDEVDQVVDPHTEALAVKMAARMAAADKRREENLDKKAKISRRNQERAEEVRKRRVERQKKRDRLNEICQQTCRDDRLADAKELLDELDLL